MKRIDPVLREQARNMRRNPTWHERELWEQLRRSQLGVRFRRQHPIGPYIVDFAASTARLVVEIDGWSHAETTVDAIRDAELNDRGWAVMHFTNGDIGHHLDRALSEIRAEIALRLPKADKIDRSRNTGTRLHPSPDPSQREGDS